MLGKFNLLTEEQIKEEYLNDYKLFKEINDNDKDYIKDAPIRKWKFGMQFIKKNRDTVTKTWNAIRQLDFAELTELFEWCSDIKEPQNPNGGGPTRVCRYARIIRYEMTPKQREVAYKIMNERYDKYSKAYCNNLDENVRD